MRHNCGAKLQLFFELCKKKRTEMRFQFTINNLQDFRLPKIIVRAKRDKNLQITKKPRVSSHYIARRSGVVLLSANLNVFRRIKAIQVILAMRNITELVRENTRATYLRLNITMRVAVDPITDSRVRYIIT